MSSFSNSAADYESSNGSEIVAIFQKRRKLDEKKYITITLLFTAMRTVFVVSKGDSGYPLLPYVMTPKLHEPEGSLAARYAQCHVRASTCMKHCIEIVKGRWTSLRKNRVLHYALEVAARIVNAVCVLHNIALRWRLPEPEYFYNKINELPPVNNDQPV